MAKKFSVISLHCFTECNMNPPCKFCYKKRTDKSLEKPEQFWFDLIPYISRLTEQVAQGGGEIFLRPEFVKKFGKLCKKHKLIYNVTSNGKLLMKMNDKELKEVLKDVTMVSLSYDSEKIKTKQDLTDYVKLIQRIKKLTKCQVGSNLLVEKSLTEGNGLKLLATVIGLFDAKVDRIFCLSMKNHPTDILKIRDMYIYLTKKYKHFYVDDASKMIIENNSYDNWKGVCHRGKSLISIGETGGISTCSFASPFVYLKEPKDLLKIKIPKCEKGTNSCPFLKYN